MTIYYEEKAEKKVDEKVDWIWTYADMVTLLLCFFVLLFAASKTEEHKLQAISNAFRGLPWVRSPFINDGTESPIKLDELASQLKKEDMGGMESDVLLDDKGITVSFNEAALFDSASAKPKENTTRNMEKFAAILYTIPNSIIVEGHTDDLPIKTGLYPSNWGLSAARAAAIADILEELDIESHRIEIAAFGSTRPKAANDSPEGRNTNRRIDILVKPYR
ncbi:MAG: OmpA family protein [Proteobacteria bacterium]|nr:OmpA family protein [Pseudomonadota bacterium]